MPILMPIFHRVLQSKQGPCNTIGISENMAFLRKKNVITQFSSQFLNYCLLLVVEAIRSIRF